MARPGVCPQRAEERLGTERRTKGRGVGERRGEGNTHLLFLRGRGKSFWKKHKEKETKKILGREKKQTYLFIYVIDLHTFC